MSGSVFALVQLKDIEQAIQGVVSPVTREDRLRSLYSLWADAGEEVVINAFRTETAPDGTPWAPLSPITLEEDRIRNVSRVGTLRVTRTFYDSFYATVTSNGTEIGNNLRESGDYPDSLLEIHQYGTSRIPARPMLPLDSTGALLPAFIDEIEALAIDWLGTVLE